MENVYAASAPRAGAEKPEKLAQRIDFLLNSQ